MCAVGILITFFGWGRGVDERDEQLYSLFSDKKEVENIKNRFIILCHHTIVYTSTKELTNYASTSAAFLGFFAAFLSNFSLAFSFLASACSTRSF